MLKTFLLWIFIRGFGPDPKKTKIEITSFVPTLTSVANYKSTMNLFALPITTEGISTTTISKSHLFDISCKIAISFLENVQLIAFHMIFSWTIANVETRQLIDFDVIERDGKEYIKIKNVRPHLKISNFSVQFKSKTGNPTVNDTVNKVINDNWREIYAELKQDLEKNVGDVIKSIISPLFDEIPYQDFFLQ